MKSTTTTGEDDDNNPTKSRSTPRKQIIVCLFLVVFLATWVVGFRVVFRFTICGALGRRQWKNHHPTTCFASDKIPKNEASHKKDHHHYPVCIVGAGLSGSVLAERYATLLGTRVWMIEKRSHIGGNCHDYVDDETGIRVSKYGAHLFHTSQTYVADYIRQFGGPWKAYRHQVRAFVDGQYVPIPVNIETVNTLYGLNMTTTREMKDWLTQEQITIIPSQTNNTNHNTSETVALSRVGRRLYETLFRPYTWKQWNRDPSDLDPSVLARIPVRTDFGLDYFDDPIQMQPLHGFTSVVRDMLRSPLIRVDLNVDFQQVKDQLHKNCEKIYYTGPIDVYFGSLGWPRLEYRSLEFERVVVVKNSSTTQTSFYQPHFVVNYPSTEFNFTRIVEYKHLSNALAPGDNDGGKTTVFFKERSITGGEPFYPVPNARNQALYRRYQAMAAQQADKVTFVGRLANYKYYNMDEAIANALQVFEKDTGILQSTLNSARMNH